MWPYFRALLKHPEQGELVIELTPSRVDATLFASLSDKNALSKPDCMNCLKEAFGFLCRRTSPTRRIPHLCLQSR
jgi:hypothetical protein